MSALLEIILGPIGAVVGALALVAGAYFGGKSKARSEDAAQDAKDYRNERQQIDDEVSGIGGNDADSIKRLRDIADRRGGGKD